MSSTVWPSLNRQPSIRKSIADDDTASSKNNNANLGNFSSSTPVESAEKIENKKLSKNSVSSIPPPKCMFLAFEEDSKQCVSKSESDQLRSSVLQMNRPKNPYHDPSSLSSSSSSTSSGCSSLLTPTPPSSSSSSPPSSMNVSPKLQQSIKKKITPSSISMIENIEDSTKCIGGRNTSTYLKKKNSTPHVQPSKTTQQISPATSQQKIMTSNSPYTNRAAFVKPVAVSPLSKVVRVTPKPRNESSLDTGLIEECTRSTQRSMRFLEQLEFEDHDRRERQKQNFFSRSLSNKLTVNEDRQSNEKDSWTPSLMSPESSRTESSIRGLSPSSFSGGGKNSLDPPQYGRGGVMGGKNGAEQTSFHHIDKKLIELRVGGGEFTDRICSNQGSANSANRVESPRILDSNLGNSLKNPSMIFCKACQRPILESVINAFDGVFHPECFCCKFCNVPLDGVPFTFYEGDHQAPLCMQCYELYFVSTCHGCRRPINSSNGSGQLVRIVVDGNEFHVECYKCEGCGLQLNNKEGSRCYPIDHHLLCRSCHMEWKKLGGFNKPISDL